MFCKEVLCVYLIIKFDFLFRFSLTMLIICPYHAIRYTLKHTNCMFKTTQCVNLTLIIPSITTNLHLNVSLSISHLIQRLDNPLSPPIQKPRTSSTIPSKPIRTPAMPSTPTNRHIDFSPSEMPPLPCTAPNTPTLCDATSIRMAEHLRSSRCPPVPKWEDRKCIVATVAETIRCCATSIIIRAGSVVAFTNARSVANSTRTFRRFASTRKCAIFMHRQRSPNKNKNFDLVRRNTNRHQAHNQSQYYYYLFYFHYNVIVVSKPP